MWFSDRLAARASWVPMKWGMEPGAGLAQSTVPRAFAQSMNSRRLRAGCRAFTAKPKGKTQSGETGVKSLSGS